MIFVAILSLFVQALWICRKMSTLSQLSEKKMKKKKKKKRLSRVIWHLYLQEQADKEGGRNSSRHTSASLGVFSEDNCEIVLK